MERCCCRCRHASCEWQEDERGKCQHGDQSPRIVYGIDKATFSTSEIRSACFSGSSVADARAFRRDPQRLGCIQVAGCEAADNVPRIIGCAYRQQYRSAQSQWRRRDCA